MKFKIIVLILLMCIAYNLFSAFNKVSQTSATVSQKTIIIDAGHGGEDGGAVGVGGVHEAEINLAITLKLAQMLEEDGYNVALTRDEDEDLADKSIGTISGRKKSDMNNRLKLINETEALLVLSIHQNFFEQSQYSGAQVFFAHEDSKALAQIIQANIVADVQPNNNRLSKQVDNKYLLNGANKPMVIVECGFISNQEETKNLQDEEYQKQMAKAIFNAVKTFTT